MEPAKNDFGGLRDQTYRRAQGLSRKSLAERLGVDESTVARWEGG